ncbi:hypothetical protein FLA105534_02155 [Flavobacterium bizetiae]|uniref:Uncharacterized protein n=1 Tax=Flavobacterium bizetiae TaxID=2704140 RepID=A0A6J4GJS3_9FLAO|nr:hypothetical protein [Flavobacterium bizetiae]CAA9198515.1 hypothetical protein FLA105534_02155 [Flavobacterium bizetiae]CAD5341175.1 hypothetical protein FLA105535_01139 [Flavobacterium bizetiae]CAD5347144.1 hypothetical protein FLA105534_01097 [Flavobacterium bizetiae]
MIEKYFLAFFNNWLKPIIFWIVSIVLLIVANSFNNPTLEKVCFTIFCLGLIGLLISAFYQLSKKKWLKTILTLVLFGSTIVIGLIIFLTLFFINQETPDTWAKNLKIPKNIQIDNPVDMEFGNNFDSKKPDSITNRIVEHTEFQLYNSFQPGIYEYEFWIGKIERGTIYLKAFEITQNISLSDDKLPKNSSIKIYNPTDSIKKFSLADDFKIYEGDWGQPYAARFEVWFKPDNGKKERKLFFKNYKIEGWMR